MRLTRTTFLDRHHNPPREVRHLPDEQTEPQRRETSKNPWVDSTAYVLNPCYVTHSHTHPLTPTCAYTHVHTHTNIPALTPIRTCLHALTHTPPRALTHTHAHTNTPSHGHLHARGLSEHQDSPIILVKGFNYAAPTPVISPPPAPEEESGPASQGQAPRPRGQDVHIWQGGRGCWRPSLAFGK